DGETTATSVWLKLESNFMTKTLTNRVYLKSKLFTCRMEEGSSIQEYVNRFDRIISDLKDIDVKVEDEDPALILLLSLPKSYENLVQTLMLVGDSLSMEETRNSLLADDLRKVATSSMASGGVDKDQAQGLFVTGGRSNERGKGKGGKSRSKSRGSFKKTCFSCGELGHFKAACPKRKLKQKNEGYKEKREMQEAGYV